MDREKERERKRERKSNGWRERYNIGGDGK